MISHVDNKDNINLCGMTWKEEFSTILWIRKLCILYETTGSMTVNVLKAAIFLAWAWLYWVPKTCLYWVYDFRAFFIVEPRCFILHFQCCDIWTHDGKVMWVTLLAGILSKRHCHQPALVIVLFTTLHIVGKFSEVFITIYKMWVFKW